MEQKELGESAQNLRERYLLKFESILAKLQESDIIAKWNGFPQRIALKVILITKFTPKTACYKLKN